MNDVALLRNLSKSNVYDVAGQHSDDEEYDKGIPLATVVKDAIDDDDDRGGKCTPALPPPALPIFNIDRLRELSKFDPNDCMDSSAGGDDNDDIDDALDNDDGDGGGKSPGNTKRVRPGEGFYYQNDADDALLDDIFDEDYQENVCPFQTSRITNAGAIASWAAPSSTQMQRVTRRDDMPPNESNSQTKLVANFINK